MRSAGVVLAGLALVHPEDFRAKLPSDRTSVWVIAPGEAPLRTLNGFLLEQLDGLVTAVHLLPIFPATSDDGFAVRDYTAVDPTFGHGGWTVLPFRGVVTAVIQARSGRIFIGGDNGGGGCCTLNWAAALSARGQLDRGFGRRGRDEWCRQPVR